MLNSRSYSFHYRNIDSTRVLAERALSLTDGYDAGRAEALNNLAFVSIVKMDYDRAHQLLDSISTNNLLEMLIADIQHMRLCQRQSHNKLFYDYHERATRLLRRIDEERDQLTDHQLDRLIYAQSEFCIVTSIYYYYVGLQEPSVKALEGIDVNGPIMRDTAQLLNYYYNVGAGGIITSGSQAEINQQEFDYLMRCYLLAQQSDYPFFEAQAMQAMSEHLQNPQWRDILIRDNLPAMKFINLDHMADTLLAGNLAQRALELFTAYGDVYQTAGAYRTLAECFWAIQDYQSAGICLQNALNQDTIINRAPDLVASILEQLSLVYSAIDDKANSDKNRNEYLDIQEQTRQDRQLEARAEQLDRSSRQLNRWIIAVVAMLILVCMLLLLFDRMRRRSDARFSLSSLMQPLDEWKRSNNEHVAMVDERNEEVNEQIRISHLHVLSNKRRNLEQRAKISLVNTVTPFIDRMIHEVRHLLQYNDTAEVRAERYAYMSELTDKINDYNNILTQWIQMRQGAVSLHVESFRLQELFDIVKKGRMSFQLRGVQLTVKDTADVVKADRTLTLFMINTMADNARKFTPQGGVVEISSTSTDDYVEISVKDSGVGMNDEQKSHVFDHKPIFESGAEGLADHSQRSHGFGLMNCKGIIEKYRKLSQIFKVCTIDVESEEGKGSRFFFRLPKGVVRLLLAIALLCGSHQDVLSQRSSVQAAGTSSANSVLVKAKAFADSAYYCNVNGRYRQTLVFADSCLKYLNQNYLLVKPDGGQLMRSRSFDASTPAELAWFHDSLMTSYDVILDIRNESAVAALALHEWDLYRYNNKVYTQLFRELSADNTLASYCRVMQRSENNKNVAITILVILLLMTIPAYYLVYYRHQVYYRFCIDRVNRINNILLSESSAETKLQQIDNIWDSKVLTLSSDRLAPLNNLVLDIKQALQNSVISENELQTNLELAEDELRRVDYENDKLHISNNVLDNCLSTLKHETMYYPSRIKTLIDGTDDNLPAIAELLTYYKELYSLLSAQAMRQIDDNVRVDKDMIDYLFEILQKQGGGATLSYDVANIDDRYVMLNVQMPQLHLNHEQTENLFTPSTVDLNFMLCRQIVREFGEATNARGCGIMAVERPEGGTIIKITITKSIWKSLKLSS